jgi:hypothetical protein
MRRQQNALRPGELVANRVAGGRREIYHHYQYHQSAKALREERSTIKNHRNTGNDINRDGVINCVGDWRNWRPRSRYCEAP